MQEREERKRREKREDENREEERTRRMQRLEQKAKEKEDQRLKEEENKLLRIQKDEEKQLDICRREKNDLEEEENIRKQIREKENKRSLINGISLIEHSLKKAYQINVIELEDEGLLENKKNIVSIDQLRFKLVEKVTKLCGTIPIDYENRNNIVEKFSEIPDNISFLHEEYVTKVRNECSGRNISDSNLRDGCKLKIELKRFSGYDSATDIYSFQAEFEKLHTTRFPKALLPDYLKYIYLEGSALLLVKGRTGIDEIWVRVKEAFGNTKVLLHNKLNEISKFGLIWKIKDKEKLIHVLAKLVYAMTELRELAVRHKIENSLYYGGSIEAIDNIIGYKDRDRFVLQHVGIKLTEEARWDKLVEFLKQKLKGQEELYLIEKSAQTPYNKEDKSFKSNSNSKRKYFSEKETTEKRCFICGEIGHQVTSDHRRNNVVQYFCCKKFAELTPAGRFILLREKGLCHQCLAPGAALSTSKHRQDCFSRYCCKNKIHEKHVKKKHVLVCEEHKHHQENKELLEEYRNNCILRLKENLPEFTRQISFHSKSGVTIADTTERNKSNDVERMESAIYILQMIEIQSERFNIFFDSGCGDLVSRRDGVSRLQKFGRSSQERPGPIKLMGVGNQISECKHGLYKVSLPLFNGREAVMSGVCIDQVTARFPTYPLKGEVESDIIKVFKSDWHSKSS